MLLNNEKIFSKNTLTKPLNLFPKTTPKPREILIRFWLNSFLTLLKDWKKFLKNSEKMNYKKISNLVFLVQFINFSLPQNSSIKKLIFIVYWMYLW